MGARRLDDGDEDGVIVISTRGEPEMQFRVPRSEAMHIPLVRRLLTESEDEGADHVILGDRAVSAQLLSWVFIYVRQQHNQRPDSARDAEFIHSFCDDDNNNTLLYSLLNCAYSLEMHNLVALCCKTIVARRPPAGIVYY
jgi:hypothetical protein